jgi:hypothetical protein
MILENLLNKYKKLTTDEHIKWMCDEILTWEMPDTMQIFKTSRWLGFIQGYLYAQKMRNVEELKNETRGIDGEFLDLSNQWGDPVSNAN